VNQTGIAQATEVAQATEAARATEAAEAAEAAKELTIQLYGTADDSIVDGPGIRFAIFTQGCNHGCPGCHNPDAQPFIGGTATTTEELWDKIEANPLIAGITLSGGEPFEQAAASLSWRKGPGRRASPSGHIQASVMSSCLPAFPTRRRLSSCSTSMCWWTEPFSNT